MFVPWIFPKTRWLMRFVARLLELKPGMTPAAGMMMFDKFEAQRLAGMQIEATRYPDPEIAGELYAGKSAADEG
jgi:hypothetical protein